MAKRGYLVEPVNWPESDVALEAAVGRVVIAWSVLDREIDDAVRLVLRCEPHLAGCVTANLGAQTKLDIFLALIHTLFHINDEDCEERLSERMKSAMRAYQEVENAFVADVERLVADTRKKAVEFRNWMAHGQPHLVKVCAHTEFWIWGKQAARKGGVTMTFRKFTPEPFDDATMEIRELVDRWNDVMTRLPRRLDVQDSVDRES